VHSEDSNQLVFMIDGTILEFRKDSHLRPEGLEIQRLTSRDGGVVMVEVRNLPHAMDALRRTGSAIHPLAELQHPLGGTLAVFADLDGNPFELWERPASV
jgi:hypothetical protein